MHQAQQPATPLRRLPNPLSFCPPNLPIRQNLRLRNEPTKPPVFNKSVEKHLTSPIRRAPAPFRGPGLEISSPHCLPTRNSGENSAAVASHSNGDDIGRPIATIPRTRPRASAQPGWFAPDPVADNQPPFPSARAGEFTCIKLMATAAHRGTPGILKNRDLFLFDDFSANLRKRVLRRGGARVKLPGEAFPALAVLLQRAPNVVPPERLRAAIWGEGVVEHHVLAEIVDSLRAVLGERPEGGPYVETVAKSGYRFTASVQRVRRERPPTAWHALAPAAIAVVIVLGAFAVWRIAAARTPLNPEAVRLFRSGMVAWAQGRENNDGDERNFRQAIRLQPSYAPAHAGLAAVLATRSYPALDAKAEVRKALDLDPSLADAHAVMGFLRMFQDWSWNGARDSFEHALKLEPDNTLAMQWYGVYLALQGHAAEAEQMLERGARQNPASIRMIVARCQVLYWNGRLPEAAQVCGAGLARNPESGLLRGLMGKIHAASARFADAGDTMPPAWRARFRESVAAQGGRGFYLTLCDAADSMGSGNLFEKARCEAGLEDRDAAIRRLNEAVRAHQFASAFLCVDPAYRILHPERRFQELCRQVGVPMLPE